MKKIITLCVVMLLGACNIIAQEGPTNIKLGEDGTYSYEKVFDVPGKHKEETYEAIKAWVVKNVKSVSNTDYFDDKNKSNISTTVVSIWNSGIKHANYDYKLNIEIKDGRYRVSAVSFMCQTAQRPIAMLGDIKTMLYTKKMMRELVEYIDDTFGQTMTSIQNTVSKKSDW